ncbi:MAG: hypothetical protein SFU86_13830 [Pirellulaceae bacterium]|nr:hypothetical protein [Pirellulaceae bacterium]
MPLSRRRWIASSTLASAAALLPRTIARATEAKFQVHAWRRDARNPIFPPGNDFDATCCMNPFVVRQGEEYLLFYGGGDKSGRRRVCLATAPVGDLSRWTRHGPLFETGGKGAFDETWCVLPCVHKIGGKWHLYYSGRSADRGTGLQAFRGIGLATSDNLRDWQRSSTEPVLQGDGFDEWPQNKGIAGGARIVEVPQPDGGVLYRMHYTLATGTPSKDLRIDQAKQAVIAHSQDGLTWTDRRVALRPRADADYENAATIALNVWKTATRWRAIYAGIGTKFGAYSICEAISDDGLVWERGRPGENLALPPTGSGWESKMTEYPNVVDEGENLRLFYCGNGYGATGIGTAVAKKLD